MKDKPIVVSFRKKGYKDRLNNQTLEWVKGNPIHNKIDDECCPDFSCCSPHLLAPSEVRQTFYNAVLKDDFKTRDRLLMEFLSKMISADCSEKKVHIAGIEESRQEIE